MTRQWRLASMSAVRSSSPVLLRVLGATSVAVLGATSVAVLGAAAVIGTPSAALAAPAENCPQPAAEQATPWAQRLLGADRAWSLSRGGGSRIALLDSGVDASRPQLAGRVEPGFDAVAGSGAADSDCLGTGTAVAGVMVAQPVQNNALAGVAPNAKVVPVRVVAAQGFGQVTVDPGVLAAGIDWAVNQKVTVICVADPVFTDDPRVRASVAHATDAGIPVIAAVGDRGDSNGGNPKPYPAGYPGVIGVGAIDVNGARWQASGHGSFVDLVAPGAGVLTLARAGAATAANGTGVAAGFVAASAALVRAHFPGFSLGQVAAQLDATAIPAAAGPGSQDLGKGIVNPYGALTDLASDASPVPLPGLARHQPSEAELRRAAAWSGSRTLATTLALVAGGLIVVVLVAALAMPHGRRRRWRATLPAPIPRRPEPEEPGPPLLLFDEQGH